MMMPTLEDVLKTLGILLAFVAPFVYLTKTLLDMDKEEKAEARAKASKEE